MACTDVIDYESMFSEDCAQKVSVPATNGIVAYLPASDIKGFEWSGDTITKIVTKRKGTYRGKYFDRKFRKLEFDVAPAKVDPDCKTTFKMSEK